MAANGSQSPGHLAILRAIHALPPERLTHIEWSVLMVLVLYADQNGRNAFPSVPTLAADTRLCARSVYGALSRLTDHGFIRQTGKHARGVTIYELALDKLDLEDIRRPFAPAVAAEAIPTTPAPHADLHTTPALYADLRPTTAPDADVKPMTSARPLHHMHPIRDQKDLDLAENEDRGIYDPLDHAHTARARARARDGGGVWVGPERNPHGDDGRLINGHAQRLHAQHSWCPPTREGLCITQDLHREFVTKSQKPDGEVRAWYVATIAKYDGQPIGDDRFRFWRNEFAAWIPPVTATPSPFQRPDEESDATVSARLWAKRAERRRA